MLKRRCAAFVLASSLVLLGCNDGPSGPTNAAPPAPPPPAPVTTVIFQDSGTFPADSAGYLEFAIPSAGTLNATVDWTFASNAVVISLTTNACDDFIAAFQGRCSNLGTPVLGASKPKVLSAEIAQAGRGRLWIANLGDDESMAVQITLTSLGAASASRATLPSFAEAWVRVK